MLGEALEREFGDGSLISSGAGFESAGIRFPVKFHLRGEVIEEDLREPTSIVVSGADK